MTSIVDARIEVRERLAQLLEAHPVLAGASIDPYPPTDLSVSNEHIWCHEVTGGFQPGPNVRGRQVNDDVFTVTVRVLTKRGGTQRLVGRRVAEIVGAVYEIVAEGGYQGVPLVDWGVEDRWEVDEVAPGSFDDATGTTEEGDPFGAAELGVDFEVRYFGGRT